MGQEAWRDFDSWPPPGHPMRRLHLHPGGVLAAEVPDDSAPDRYRYDPDAPTPAVGGVRASGGGRRDNTALEARSDVLTYTTPALSVDTDVIGEVRAEIWFHSSRPSADVFVRLCDVDAKGHSRNVSDRLIRLDPAIPAGRPQELEIELDPCFHRIVEGHQVRLQISGGAFPRYARNLGTDSLPLDGRTLRPSTHTIDCQASSLRLPIG
jgi:putative CocE/NonD family hydrolase